MLTGDKLETATCIAKSSHLVSRSQDIHVFRPVRCFTFLFPSFARAGSGDTGDEDTPLIFSWLIVLCGPRADLEQRRGPSGAQRLQKETWLCSGHLGGLLRGATTQHNTTQHTQRHFSVQQMMLRMQPNRRGENRKHISAKTNTSEFNESL